MIHRRSDQLGDACTITGAGHPFDMIFDIVVYQKSYRKVALLRWSNHDRPEGKWERETLVCVEKTATQHKRGE